MESRPCANCGRVTPPDELDRNDWCDGCRRQVVKRATVVGRITGAVAAIAVAVVLLSTLELNPRFLAGWLVLLAAVYLFAYKLVRRVAFEYIRARGVPPPPEE